MLLIVVCLVGFGTIMVYSASAALAQVRFENGHFFLQKWAVRMLISLIVMALVIRVDYHVWAKASKLLLALGFLGLFAVLFLKLLSIGKVRGAYRWIPLPGGTFQPADLMRLVLVIYLAESLSRRRLLVRDFSKGYLPHIIIVGTAMGLIILQPDLGTALAIGLTCTLVLYLGGVRFHYLFGTFLALLPFLYLIVFGFGYRKERVLSFLNPTDDLQGSGYHVAQSLLALGSGGWTGVGLGQSLQKYFFLPEPHTDFVFSIVGEELGLIGTIVLLLLFLLFGRLGLRIARSAPDTFGYLLAVGITCMVEVYALINMGVATGLLPVTGLPLPFISYGGSSLLLTLIATGILINISKSGSSNPGSLPRRTAIWTNRTFPRSKRPAFRGA